MKRRQLEGRAKELDLRQEEMDAMQQAEVEQRKELEVKNKLHVLRKKSLEECLREADVKERQLQDRSKELESQEKQMDAFQLALEQRRKDLELKEKQLTEKRGSHCPLAAATVYQSDSAQLVPAMDGSSLQFLLNELLKKHDMVHQLVSSVLKVFSDPGKLVLDAVQGFYATHLRKDHIELDTGITRKSCILMLDQLIVYSPQISPHMQQVAIKVACEWKRKMIVAADNQLEILGFLHLLAAFRIAHAFNVDELQALLDRVADHKQALKLQQYLKTTKMTTVSSIPGPIKTKQLDHITTSTAEEMSSYMETLAALGGGSLHLCDPAWAQEHILSVFRISPDKAKFALEVIEVRLLEYMKKGKNHEARFQDAALELCAILLEQLMEARPLVQPDVKMNAVKLAAEWEEKLKPDKKKSLEVLLFLEFIAAYGLGYSLDRNEGFQLLQIIAPHKQAPAISQALNFCNMVTGNFTY